MKRILLTVTIAAGLIALAPGARADHWDEDVHADLHSLWEWQGHLEKEADHRGAGHHIHEELDSTRASLQEVEHQLHEHHWHHEHVRGELDGTRDQLHHISDELHWRGEVRHRPGFTIEFR
jgi:hypothetical protein